MATTKKDVIFFLKDYFVSVYSLLAYEPKQVYLKLTVGTDGILKDCRIINTRHRKAEKLFAELVRKAPKFQPASKNGVLIEKTILLPMRRYERDPVFFDNRPINHGNNIPNQGTLYYREQMLNPLQTN